MLNDFLISVLLRTGQRATAVIAKQRIRRNALTEEVNMSAIKLAVENLHASEVRPMRKNYNFITYKTPWNMRKEAANHCFANEVIILG